MQSDGIHKVESVIYFKSSTVNFFLIKSRLHMVKIEKRQANLYRTLVLCGTIIRGSRHCGLPFDEPTALHRDFEESRGSNPQTDRPHFAQIDVQAGYESMGRQ